MTNLPAPPAQIQPYIDVLGIDGTIDFLLTFGGAELVLSVNPNRGGRLARHFGREAATRLAARAGHLPRRVPLAKAWIAQVWRAQGLPVAEIARRLHASDVAVRGWLRRDLAGQGRVCDPDQPDLFDRAPGNTPATR